MVNCVVHPVAEELVPLSQAALAIEWRLATTAAMPHNRQPMLLYFTRTYERAIRKLLSPEARREMEAAIMSNPDTAPVIRGTGGIRKLRWAGSGRGKRGGIRAIYFYPGPEAIYMLTAYAKADRDDLTAADAKALSKLVATIRKGRREK